MQFRTGCSAGDAYSDCVAIRNCMADATGKGLGS
jgi:hypothetical protein